MNTVNCRKCNKVFTKWSMKSTQVFCRECESARTKKVSAQMAVANSELSKKQILNKLDKMEIELKAFRDEATTTISSLIDKELKKRSVSFEAKVESINKTSGLEYSDQFKELKASIEASQAEYEAKMKTLLAIVNTRSIETAKETTDMNVLLKARVKELRIGAKKAGWNVTAAKKTDRNKN